MKNLILLFAVFVTLTTAMAQNKGKGNGKSGGKNVVPESAVPAAVVSAFKAANPNVTNIVWRKSPKKEVYRVAYTTSDGMRKAMHYANDGKCLRAIDIGIETLLPANILSDVKAKAAGAEIKRAEKHTLVQKNNEVRYHVIAVNKAQKIRYHFRYDATGKLLDLKQKTMGQGPQNKETNETDDIMDEIED